MNPQIAFKLVSKEVQNLIELLGSEQEDALSLQATFRNFLPPKVAQAAGELVDLRRRARTKFSRSAQMFFTREALEVATAEVPARYRADRMRGCQTILDACCGIGGDLIALGKVARVLAADCNPVLACFASANAAAYGIENARIYAGDLTQIRPPADALFLDPARRENRKRARDPENWSPPPVLFAELIERYGNVAIKASPTVQPEVISPADLPVEAEFVSYRGECRELVLWYGDFRTTQRRATVLTDESFHSLEGDPAAVPMPEILEPEAGSWILEPDPALMRSGLLAQLAAEHSLALIDPEIAFLVGTEAIASPFLRSFRVIDAETMDQRKVRSMLKRHGIGKLTVKKRGHPSDAESIRRSLARREGAAGTLIVTRREDRHFAYLVQAP